MVVVDEVMLDGEVAVAGVDNDVARLEIWTEGIAETAEVHIPDVADDAIEGDMGNGQRRLREDR